MMWAQGDQIVALGKARKNKKPDQGIGLSVFFAMFLKKRFRADFSASFAIVARGPYRL
jgi:hypothetical protein